MSTVYSLFLAEDGITKYDSIVVMNFIHCFIWDCIARSGVREVTKMAEKSRYAMVLVLVVEIKYECLCSSSLQVERVGVFDDGGGGGCAGVEGIYL